MNAETATKLGVQPPDPNRKPIITGDTRLSDGVEASEPGNAERFAAIARGKAKYAPKLRAWLVYEGGRWVEDSGDIKVMAIAKQVPRAIFMYAADIKPAAEVMATTAKERTLEDAKAIGWYELHHAFARKSNNEAQLKHCFTLARDLPGMTVEYEDMDTNPDLVNFLNGTFNVSTGQLQPHDPADLLMKQIQLNYVKGAAAPKWHAFLRQMQPDPNVRKLLQRITGSALTGDAVQHLFANVGNGANGKDTFFGRVMTVAGSYAVQATEAMLIDNGSNNVHDEDLARLKGCRMLVFPESGAGDRLNEARLKNLTGGGRIRARHLHGKPFDLTPSHTAFIHTNHEPRVRGTDNGIWRRMVLIPWPVIISEDKKDLDLAAKLETELEGIAAWLIEGAMAWRKEGLNLPPTIKLAGEQYRQSQDTIGRWLHECWDNLVSSQGFVKSETLRNSYVAWCDSEGLKPWSQKAVGDEMVRRGYTNGVRRTGNTTGRFWATPVTRDVTPVTHTTHTSNSGNESSNTQVESEVVGEGVTRVTPDSGWNERERQYLTESGYPVPPTDEELERYFADQVESYVLDVEARS